MLVMLVGMGIICGPGDVAIKIATPPYSNVMGVGTAGSHRELMATPPGKVTTKLPEAVDQLNHWLTCIAIYETSFILGVATAP
jgi:hypothetical protein